MLEFFTDLYITLTPQTYTKAYNAATGAYDITYVPVAALTGPKWDISHSTKLFNVVWAEDVVSIVGLTNVSTIKNSSRVLIGSDYYEVSSIHDPVSNNTAGFDNVYLVGLRVHKADA